MMEPATLPDVTELSDNETAGVQPSQGQVDPKTKAAAKAQTVKAKAAKAKPKAKAQTVKAKAAKAKPKAKAQTLKRSAAVMKRPWWWRW